MTSSRSARLTTTVVLLIGAASILSAEGTAPAADPHAGHAMPSATDSPATAAFKAASAAMHSGMAIPYTGNPDVDFIAGMIPHHQGAVDAARIVLEHGTDPDVRTFAEQVIAAQEAEIAWMTDWLSKHGQ